MRARFTAIYSGVQIDSQEGLKLKDGTSLSLPPKELAFLCLLMSEAGRLVPKDKIVREVWQAAVSDSSIARCASSLRARLLKHAPQLGKAIKTDFGRGYRFDGRMTASQTLVTDDAFYALINALEDFIVLKDAECRWQAANKAALAMYRLSDLDWMGKTNIELAEMVPDIKENLIACDTTDAQAWVSRLPTHFIERINTSGADLVFHVSKSPLFNVDGSPKMLIVHGRDVTELLRAEGMS